MMHTFTHSPYQPYTQRRLQMLVWGLVTFMYYSEPKHQCYQPEGLLATSLMHSCSMRAIEKQKQSWIKPGEGLMGL